MIKILDDDEGNVEPDQEVIDFLIENNIEEILDNIMQKQEKD